MRIISVMSPKGGIGKTTTADSIAVILAKDYGKKVLVLDGDPQGDTSKTFDCFEPEGLGMSTLLEHHACVGGTELTDDLIRNTEYENISTIPANGYLMQTDMYLMQQEDKQVTRLKEALEEVQDLYDYCICDCGRLLDMVVLNMLIASELVIAPVKVGGYEIEAIVNLREQIADLQEINGNLRMKVLLTMLQKNKTSEEFEMWLRSSDFDMFRTNVRRSVVVEKSTTLLLPLPEFSKSCAAAKDYKAVVEELLGEMEG